MATIDLTSVRTTESGGIAQTTVAAPSAPTVAAPSAPTVAEEKQTYATFRDFNNSSFQCRVVHTEVKTGQYGEYVIVTAFTNLKDGEDSVAVQFRSSNGILKLAKGGHLMKNRRIHVTGSVIGFASSYQKDGMTIALSRPRIELASATIQLGAKPTAK